MLGLYSIPQNLDDWSFNVFSVNEASENHCLKYVGYELLQKYDLITKFKINTQVLDSFLYAVEAGYSKFRNPYHNLVHGADVAQTVHYVLSQSHLAVSESLASHVAFSECPVNNYAYVYTSL